MLRCVCSRCQPIHSIHNVSLALTNAAISSPSPPGTVPRVQFADTGHWLRYFPPLARRDLKLMGCGIDWRRRWACHSGRPPSPGKPGLARRMPDGDQRLHLRRLMMCRSTC